MWPFVRWAGHGPTSGGDSAWAARSLIKELEAHGLGRAEGRTKEEKPLQIHLQKTPPKMFLGLLLTSWLVLAKAATLAPKGVSVEQAPPPASFDGVLQEQVQPEKIPLDFFLQKEIDLTEGLDLPMQVQNRPSSPFNPRGFDPSKLPQSNLAEFPPARPAPSNIANICSEGRKKLSYGPWNLPQTSFSHLSRQGEALNELEAGVKTCCQLDEGEKLPCCLEAWEKVLMHYCRWEFSVKTKPHECCLKDQKEDRFSCFTNLAPFPAYDMAFPLVSLAEINPQLLDTLCGQFTLLNKQKLIPSLIQNITESCCQLQGSERIQCSKDAKSHLVSTLCTSRRNTWKDPQRCCAHAEDAPREACFGANYLDSLPLASLAEPGPDPMEIDIDIPTE
ncbi:extracellular matrix protein 1 [Anolis carolinensis]|uniref:extracellular matrix protein 1 n=1 Tax=Anolis carolinensis TaxID=28377 RepID=UPI002F2B3E98